MVVRRCNDLLSEKYLEAIKAILVGLDGWHLTRAELDEFPDPKLAHDRRGAHWTFDGSGYASFVTALRVPLPEPLPDTGDNGIGNEQRSKPQEGGQRTMTSIFAPSFDHALKDPSPDAVQITPFHRIVVIEGLYAFLSIDPWKKAGEMLDERWFVEVDLEEATKRLVKRHVVTGVAKDLEEAVWRAETNDVPSMPLCKLYCYCTFLTINLDGRFVIENNLEPSRRIQSILDARVPGKI